MTTMSHRGISCAGGQMDGSVLTETDSREEREYEWGIWQAGRHEIVIQGSKKEDFRETRREKLFRLFCDRRAGRSRVRRLAVAYTQIPRPPVFGSLSLSSAFRSSQSHPSLARERRSGLGCHERDRADQPEAEGLHRGLVLAHGRHRPEAERRHQLHVSRVQLQYDPGVTGGSRAADEL